MTTTNHTPSRGCYQRGCQADACAQENYRYMSRLRLDYHRGERRRIDASQSRHHIERLLATGWTQAQIARAAGLVHHVVSDVRRGQQIVANHTALAILSVPIGPAPADVRDIDATGTMRRLRALVAIGWPIEQLAPRLGMFSTALGNIARGELAHVRIKTADTVALHYQQLSRIPGPSNRGRILARKKGWHGPLAWGDNIDDPQAQPDIDDAYADAPKYERDPDRANEMVHLHLLGESIPVIAKKVGTTEKYVSDQLPVALRQRAWRIRRELGEMRAAA